MFQRVPKKEFLNKKDFYIKFLKQMANFISSRAFQENEKTIIENNNKILLDVVERIPNSIIIANEDNKIELINDRAISLLEKLILKLLLNLKLLVIY